MEFLKSIDLIFVLQFLAVVLFYYLMKFFFKKNFSEPNEEKSNLLSRIIDREGIISYLIIGVFGLLMLGGFSVLFLIFSYGVQDFFNLKNIQSWWAELLVWFSLIALYFGIKSWWDEREKNKRRHQK